jgi:hypothetical protein
MPGTLYQGVPSDMSLMSNSLKQTDPAASIAAAGVKDALDNAMLRSVSPEDAAAWQQARQQWGDMRTNEKALAGTGEQSANVRSRLPVFLAAATSNAVKKTAYARGQSDPGDLARKGIAAGMKPLPQSGTAPRAVAMHLANALGGAALGGAAGYESGDGLRGVGAGMVGGALAGRAIMSRPVQSYLRNQVAVGLGRAVANPRAAALAAALAARHATIGP